MTRRLSGIHAAWHFWYAASFGVESGLRKLGLGGIHPLTRRYASEYPTFSRHFTKLDLGSN
ncbi:DUF3265 domain-containing protein [Vibrio vulnificus]|nr:DUF3265 domain-containing protein [Vibrio vulnificus]EGR0237841.1 DUF3265 domain-containing protein [Vibrio vulnificus]ELG9630272.1 DUF3265 domain-containing protein [Vibrio vulnificus]